MYSPFGYRSQSSIREYSTSNKQWCADGSGSEMDQCVEIEQDRLVDRKTESGEDQRYYDGGGPRPPVAVADTIPGEQDHADTHRDQCPRNIDVEMIDVRHNLWTVCCKLCSGDTSQIVHPDLESFHVVCAVKEPDPVQHEEDAGRHQKVRAPQQVSVLDHSITVTHYLPPTACYSFRSFKNSVEGNLLKN